MSKGAFMTAIVAAVGSASAAAQMPLPAGVVQLLPAGYRVLAARSLSAGAPSRSFLVVALGRKDENARRSADAPGRPLLLFERRGQRFVMVGRNDHVVLKADEGGQCDPFLDGDTTIAVKGPYFTIENGVACGDHWTDFITFRFDRRTATFVFDNERRESWSFNPSRRPDAEALVRDGKPAIIRDRQGRLTPFERWRPRE